ncbi:AMP-binding protein [Flavivirga jejuensis]|uniref:AMP-binding protein n=1 Tax=Flavivirga jejuensis TaxID=870487 RepID=A0ABT8WLH8_9FLAO|nr:AMP-binding protein [Flavivirga jejuensis]MDO5974012.1 AMP-binding protein [Flavivirga jejuensis]
MRLYDLIQQNKNLRFIDTVSGKSSMVTEFHKSIAIENSQGLGFVYSDNQIDSIEVFLNFLESNFTISLLNAQLNIQFKQSLEDIYRPYYIYDTSRTEIEGYKKCSVSESITLFKRKTKQENPINKDIKLLLSTSGTTGNPKFVKLSDNNLVKNAMSILDYLPITSHDIVPLNIPITYVYGLSIFTTNCIKSNTIVCTNKDVLQKDFWEDFKIYKFSTLSGVPYVYEMLNRIGFFKKEHEFLRYMTQAGGKLSEKLISIMIAYSKTHNIPFFTQYGQTEAAGRMAFLHPNDLLTREYSIGKPIKGGEFELKEGTNELIYYGENVFGGYAKGLDDLVTFNKSNKLFTGDIAKKDADGYYYIVGRIKRIMKLFGTRINLDEVELILKNNLDGNTFICTCIEDKYLSINYLNKELTDNSIKKVLREKLNLHSSSLVIKYIENIPLTTNGKVDYKAITKNED